MTDTLNSQTFLALSARGVDVPRYERCSNPGVVHLGLGAFHRAHQALVFDALLRGGDARWGVLGVGMSNPAVADALAAQQGLYSVQIARKAGTRWQVGGAVWQTAVAARDAQTVVAALAAPHTRWVTITVTEKGYGPALADLLVQGLAARYAMRQPGITIASCDNLQHNGSKLRALVVNTARTNHAALADWINSECAFPNSMVDRIVPASTPQRLAAAQEALGLQDNAALGTEAFWEWAIERRFVDDGDAALLASAGVTVVDDVAPFETAKLRMLNGSHSLMACLGAVLGLKVISDCINEPAIRTLVHGLMTEEVGPNLARSDWPAYRDALLERFGNPMLQHSVHQIAQDSSQKIPQRWPPSALPHLLAGRVPERLAFAAAVWMRYLRGINEAGQAYEQNDPMATTLQPIATTLAGDAAASVRALGTLPAIWGDVLPQHGAWLARVTHWLDAIHTQGARAALDQLNRLTATGSAPAST